MKSMTFRTVCAMVEIVPGIELVASEGDRAVVATVTDDYGIRLSNGEVLGSLFRAAERVKELATGKRISINGWNYWRVEEAGSSLYDVRAKFIEEVSNPDLKSLFWDGFYDYCAERQDLVSAYADPSGRAENNGWYATFGLGMRGVHASAFFAQRDGWVGVNLWFTDASLYEGLVARSAEVEALLADLGGKISWREPSEKTRELQVRLDTNVSSEHWDELYGWLVTGLLRMRAVAKMLRAERDDAGAEHHGHVNQLGESAFDEPGILIKISNVNPSEMSAQELYDRVRGHWRVGLTRARNAKLAFGVCGGRIVEVYRIDEWFPAGQDEASESRDGRYQFVGHLASDELRERYMGQSVADLAQGQNPIRYVGGA